MKFAWSVFAVLVATITSAAAQASGTIPQCGLTCLLAGIQASPCEATNQTCTCTNDELQKNVTACVLEACSIKDALTTKNFTDTTCNNPIRDRTHSYYAMTISLAVISATCVLIRLATKIVLNQAALGLDDWFIVITLIVGAASQIMNIKGLTENGLGKDIWHVPFDMITRFGRGFWVMAFLYFAEVTLLKLSLTFFYLRIFPAKGVQRVLWGTVIFNSIFGLLFVLLVLFQCRPISHYWDKWDGEHKGTCLDTNSIAWSNAAVSIALDFWLLAIPIFQLRLLKMHWKKKIGVGLMFGTGTFITVVSILRLSSLVTFAKSANPTWDQLETAKWSTIEINVGMICLCMPAFRLLIGHLFPNALPFTSRGKSTGSSRSRSFGKEAGGSGNRSRNKFQNLESDLSESTMSASKKDIVLSRTYDVEYNDSSVPQDDADTAPINLMNLSPSSEVVNRSESRRDSHMKW